MDRLRSSAESLISRASRDSLRPGAMRSRNAPVANATFDVVDVPTVGGHSALFLRSGGPPPGGTGLSTTTAAMPSSSASPLPTGKTVEEPATPADPAASSVVTVNVRYRNELGRAAVLKVARHINHDFGALTSIMNVTLGSSRALDDLSANPDIDWVDRNGAVYFVQPFGKN